MNMWESNHVAFELVKVDLFKHLQAKRMYKFCRSMCKSNCALLKKLKYYFNFNFVIKKSVENIFLMKYNVNRVFDNDFNAVLSRIDYVQRNEPRSSYLNFTFSI